MADINSTLATINRATGFGTQPSNVRDPYQILATPARPAAQPATALPDYNSLYAAELKRQNDISNQQLAQIRAQNYLPQYDITGGYSRALTAAQSAVNPLYVQKLNDYLAQEQVNKARKQADTTTAQNQIQQSLDDLLAGNAVTKDRTAADTTQNISQIANQAQNFQQDSGQQFEAQRQQLLRTVGDVGAGADQNAVNQQTQAAATGEGRQVQQFAQAKDAQALGQARTFEDLARSGELGTRNAGQLTDQSNLDLNRYIEDLASQEKDYRNQSEAQRLADVYQEQERQYKLGLRQFYSTLSGYGLQNAIKAYGGI